MLLFAGLGNPEEKYKLNRHNVGFLLIDKLVSVNNDVSFKKKFKSLFSELEIKKTKIIAAKPQTFMNLSGESILEIKKFYKINNENIFIFHDDLDLETGKIKVKTGGSSGGHNGINSIDEIVGNDYHRIRIGIDHPGDKNLVESYVLNNFSDNQLKIINKIFDKILDNLSFLIDKKFDQFSSKVNN